MNEDLLRKIKRCMDLSGSSNENEAAIALKQMKALMDKHNITEGDVLASGIIEDTVKTHLRKKLPRWMTDLHFTVAQAFDCHSFIRTSWTENAKIVFIGEPVAVQIASYAYEVLHRQLSLKRKEYIATELKRYRKNLRKTALADAYCEAWVAMVYFKCRNLNPNADTEAKIKAYKEKNLNLTKYKGKEKVKSGVSDDKIAEAMVKGTKDAKDVSLYIGTEHAARKFIERA